MNSWSAIVPDFYANYKDWVRNNPQTASEIESTIKWLSYFIAGKINKSAVLTELVYSASNLLVLFNDLIIQSAKFKLNTYKDKIKIWLSVIEYSEVFMEISSKNLWGEKGKWIVVICIQLLKCISRLILILQCKEKIISSPAILPIKRNLGKSTSKSKIDTEAFKINEIGFCLKRSGRIIRKVESAPPLHTRLWKPPTFIPSDVNKADEEPKKEILQQHLIAEVLYIIKPMITLGAMAKYGQATWKPWLASAITDLTSLYLLQVTPNNGTARCEFTSAQRLEVSRRRLALLLYLMRSPFYERHSKDRVMALLVSLSKNIPLARLICKPIQQYLPHWQETYFYVWSS